MTERVMTPEEFAEWRLHPGTKAAIEAFHARRKRIRDSWEAGQLTASRVDEIALMSVAHIGECKGLALFTDLSYEDYLTELVDDK